MHFLCYNTSRVLIYSIVSGVTNHSLKNQTSKTVATKSVETLVQKRKNFSAQDLKSSSGPAIFEEPIKWTDPFSTEILYWRLSVYHVFVQIQLIVTVSENTLVWRKKTMQRIRQLMQRTIRGIGKGSFVCCTRNTSRVQNYCC